MAFAGAFSLARAAQQFRAADVTLWGLVALVAWTVAVVGANLSALVPDGVYAALHASRLDGSTVNQLRVQVAALEVETARLKRENGQLGQRFLAAEQLAGDTTRRIGALEVSLPKLVEAQNQAPRPDLDYTATGSIGAAPVTLFETEGGSVAVRQNPMPLAPALPTPAPLAQPAAAPLLADGSALGVALGFPVDPTDAEAQWQELLAGSGTLLVGLAPVLSSDLTGTRGQLVAGPLADRSAALALCAELDRRGVACEPRSFAGTALPLLN